MKQHEHTTTLVQVALCGSVIDSKSNAVVVHFHSHSNSALIVLTPSALIVDESESTQSARLIQFPAGLREKMEDISGVWSLVWDLIE
jgi:hypothetical protein